MTDDGAVELGSGRGWWRALLTLVAVVAVVLASVALPVFAGGSAPAAGFNLGQPLSGESASGGGAGGLGGLGALSPPDRTRVGSASSSPGNPYSSLNQEVHFVVRSETPAYWRTGSYDRYTGQGWERTGESAPLSGPIPVEGAAGERVRYSVTLERSASALPTVWRPNALSLERESLRLGPGRAVSSTSPVPAGTSYTGESVAPPSDPALLRSAGTDYPATVESTYTALPDREDTDVVDAFTDELTADAETPYETAVRIEEWLESEKSYSLNASHDPDNGTITSEFVFGMDRGYCEYFATAMTTMLRTQDVPARYVVGYATGERSGPDEYTVRGMHAHAWVEVYFPDVGWVRFDPTPADERTAAEREALGENPTPAPNATEATATPTATPVSGTATDSGTETGTDTGTATPTPAPTGTERPPVKVSLNRSAVPGATVEVLVTRGGDPVPSAEVLFNGDPVGITDPDGTVVARVPYTDRLDITVRTDSAGGVPAVGDAAFSVARYGQQSDNTSYTLDTNATLSVLGEVRSGANVTLLATIDDVPVRDAAVFRDGERIGRTGDSGGFSLRLPSEPGEYEYTVERGSVSGSRTVTIDALSVNRSVGWPLTVPFAPVTLNATRGGEPVANATVLVDGEPAGATGVGGSATLPLPARDSVTLAVAADGQRAETTVEGLLTTVAAIAGGVVVGAIALFGGAYRRGLTPRAVAGLAVRSLGRGARLLLIGVVSVAGALSRGVGAVGDGIRRAAARLADLGRELRARTKSPSEVARIVAAAVTAWVRRSAAAVAAVPERLRAWLTGLRAEDSGPAEGGANGAATEEGTAARERVRAAWRRFLGLLPVRRVRTLTPGEAARIAVEDARLPRGPVERLLEAYRDVSYGGADPASRQNTVEQAVESLDRDAGEEAPGADGSPGTGSREPPIDGDDRRSDSDDPRPDSDEPRADGGAGEGGEPS